MNCVNVTECQMSEDCPGEMHVEEVARDAAKSRTPHKLGMQRATTLT